MIHSVQEIKEILDSLSDLSDLNDHDLGVTEGYLAAKEGKDKNQVLTTSPNDEYRAGVEDGYKLYIEEVSKSDSLKDLIKIYKQSRSLTDFRAVADCLYRGISDAENDLVEYLKNSGQDNSISTLKNEETGETLLVESMSSEDAQKAIEQSPDRKILGVDESDDSKVLVTLGDVNDSVLHHLAKRKDYIYVKGKLFDSTGKYITDSLDDIINHIV